MTYARHISSYSINKRIVRDYDEETLVWHACIPTTTSTGKSDHLSGIYIDPNGVVCAEPDGELPIVIVLELIEQYLRDEGFSLLETVQKMTVSQVLES